MAKGNAATAAGGSTRGGRGTGWMAAAWSCGDRAMARGKKMTMATEHRSGADCTQGRGYDRAWRPEVFATESCSGGGY
ncbi:hypothetical protein SESBI_34419 [Sesbania bispinosa]|nr:hypothetical protein SESBI_34419 [Sesbania bispinosa]